MSQLYAFLRQAWNWVKRLTLPIIGSLPLCLFCSNEPPDRKIEVYYIFRLKSTPSGLEVVAQSWCLPPFSRSRKLTRLVHVVTNLCGQFFYLFRILCRDNLARSGVYGQRWQAPIVQIYE